jgi:hypothetical protein
MVTARPRPDTRPSTEHAPASPAQALALSLLAARPPFVPTARIAWPILFVAADTAGAGRGLHGALCLRLSIQERGDLVALAF